MKITKSKLKQIIRESLSETDAPPANPTIGAAVTDLGGAAKSTVKNQAVGKFFDQVTKRLEAQGRQKQVEFIARLMQTLGIDSNMLTSVKTAVQKNQKAAAKVAPTAPPPTGVNV